MSGWRVDVMQVIRLAGKDSIIKKTLYHLYYPLLNILHEWYRLKYYTAQEAVVNQAS